MNISKEVWIIHIFALLHAAVAFSCRVTGITDDLMLTLLTMLLVMILCLRGQMSVMFMAMAVIAVNIVGYGLGTGLAALLSLLPLSPLVIHPVSTLICTEIIGCGTIGCINLYRRKNAGSIASPSSKGLRWLLIAFIIIIIIRLVLILLTSGIENSRNFVIGIIFDYLFSCVALLWLAEYAIRSREQAEKSEEQANLAQYRYIKLKQQVNPHFLFNSLNVLDCMIHEQSRDEASEYTHKLADIYRYMIQNEDETTVKLRDEMSFVSKYIDLLMVRFPEGLKVSVDIPEESLSRSVIPCCVQLLIENATKHNAVSPANPLAIKIHTTPSSVIVSNNLCPKLTRATSTGLGLKYIRQQYKDISGKSIIIKETDSSYTVILPLL